MKRLVLSLSLILLVSACMTPTPPGPPATSGEAAMAEVPLIPREVLLGNPERFRGRISPDGGTISFLAPVDGVQNVMVAPIANLDDARPITRDTGRGVRVYSWAADSEHILYLQDEGGNENWQLHVVNVTTSQDRNLTPLEGVQARILATSIGNPQDILIGLNDRDARWHDVHRLNIQTGERKLVEINEGMTGYVADTDLNLAMAARSTPDGGIELFRRDSGGQWELLTVIPGGDALTTNFSQVASDGRTAYGIYSRGRNTAALVAMDIVTGDVTAIGSDERADVEQVVADPVTGEVLAYSVNYEQTKWQAVADEVRGDIAKLNAELGGNFEILSQTHANDKWILYADNPDAPGRYYAYDRKRGTVDLLFDTQPKLSGYMLAPATSHVIRACDGLSLVSYLTMPAGSDTDGDGVPVEALPMVLLVHGGPWGRDTYGFSGLVQMLANRGYAVLQVNFRASTGFGKDFVNAGDKEWGEAMHDDLLDAVEWAVARGVAIHDKVAIMGGSYGGYATLAGLAFTPKTFVAGVDIVGPSNLVTLLESIPPYWASLLDLFSQRVGDPRTDEGRALLKERSPLHQADRIVRPLLIAQGANDPRVTQAESDQIVAAMSEKGLPVTYVLFPDEGHGFARPANNLSFFGVAEAFLATHLGGRYQPMTSADLEGSTMQVPAGAELVPGLAQALSPLASPPQRGGD